MTNPAHPPHQAASYPQAGYPAAAEQRRPRWWRRMFRRRASPPRGSGEPRAPQPPPRPAYPPSAPYPPVGRPDTPPYPPFGQQAPYAPPAPPAPTAQPPASVYPPAPVAQPTPMTQPLASVAPPQPAPAQPAAPAAQPVSAEQPMSASSDALLPSLVVNLAMRELSLVDTLLHRIEQLQADEDDPNMLASLFELDNLATRMRRHGENLLVLTGQDTGGQRFASTLLLDVVRAATSEISDYERTQIVDLPDVEIIGLATDDISHLLAELLDNSIANSPAATQVMIRGQLSDDGELLVEVEDEGIGVPLDRLEDINRRLSGPPVLDDKSVRHMGMYVVGRLAYRHGVRVRLHARPFKGTVAYAVLPSRLLHAPAATVPSPVVSGTAPRPVVTAPDAARGGGGRTAGDAATTAAGLPRRSARTQAVPDAPEPDHADGTDGTVRPSSAAEVRDDLDDFMSGQSDARQEIDTAARASGFGAPRATGESPGTGPR